MYQQDIVMNFLPGMNALWNVDISLSCRGLNLLTSILEITL